MTVSSRKDLHNLDATVAVPRSVARRLFLRANLVCGARPIAEVMAEEFEKALDTLDLVEWSREAMSTALEMPVPGLDVAVDRELAGDHIPARFEVKRAGRTWQVWEDDILIAVCISRSTGERIVAALEKPDKPEKPEVKS